jgi:hypothetical protein
MSVVCLALASLSGCASVADPKQAAYLTLFEPSGDLNTKAFQAALESRFVAGSQVTELLRYVDSMYGGWCSSLNADGTLTCEGEIESCGYVFRSDAKIVGDVIGSIEFSVGPLICD